MKKLNLFFLLVLCFSLKITASEQSKKEIKRIIALSPHSVEMLYAIGAGDLIVGTVEYADYPEAAKKIPRIGNFSGIQIERVLTLKPDLIVAWKTGNKKADLEKLKSLGLNVYFTHPKNITEIGKDLIALGKMIGVEEQANILAKKINEKHNDIINQYKHKKRSKVFYQMWHDPLRTVGPNSWIESLINDCNGENIFNDSKAPYPLVSLESILMKDPEVIIIPHHSGNVGAKTEIWDNWLSIDAVKNKRLFTINGDLLHRFSPRAIEGLEKLCRAIDTSR